MSDYSARDLVVVRFASTGILLLPLLIHNWTRIPPPFWGWFAALVPLEIAASWLYMRAIRQAPLSQTQPYLAFTPVITIITGYVLLGEEVTARGGFGIALIAAGAYLLNIRQLRNQSRYPLLQPFRAMLVNPGPRWMLLVALIYSLTSVMGKGAMQYVPPEFFGPFYFVSLGLIVTVPYLVKLHFDGNGLVRKSLVRKNLAGQRMAGENIGRESMAGVSKAGVSIAGESSAGKSPVRPGYRLGVLGRRPWALLLVGGLMAIMVYSHFQALQQVEVAYMISVKRTSLLFAMLMGAWMFKERDLLLNLLAGSLMVVGVALIAL